jgi:hypothetical protein
MLDPNLHPVCTSISISESSRHRRIRCHPIL